MNDNTSDEVTVSLECVHDVSRVAHDWKALEQQVETSFFLSWGWIECWVHHLPRSVELLLVRVQQGGRNIGLGLMVERTGWRHALVHSRQLLLHECGDPYLDRIFIEHNGFLSRREDAATVTQAVLAALENMQLWDEIVLSGTKISVLTKPQGSGLRLVERRVDAPFVDLAAIRCTGKGYLETLGKNTRYAIRRSLKLYEKRGVVGLRAAETAQEALSYLALLADLHQRRWTSRGEPGAFAAPGVIRFHSHLVARLFERDEIQLFHVTAGAATIGYLYNFRKNGRVYQYQSGFSYEPLPHLKPGLVSHYLAIEANLRNGAAVYDFLAGDDRYKRNLSNDVQSLFWLTVQRDRWRFRLERLVQQVWRRWRAQ